MRDDESKDVVYFLHLLDKNQIKIGVTCNLMLRIRDHEKSHGAVKVLAVVRGSVDYERQMLKKFEQYAIPYRAKGATPEYFRAEAPIFQYALTINDEALIAGFLAHINGWFTLAPTPPTASANAAANAA